MKTPVWFVLVALGTAAVGLGGCAARPTPAVLTQADQVAESPAAREAEAGAPQAFAIAEKLRAEARQLHEDERDDEASVVAEQASVAYQEAFAISRSARSALELERARAELTQREARIAVLDDRQRVAQADADALELRARVALDTLPVSDVAKLSPERALARRAAALQLTSEARGLCLATQLLNAQAPGLTQLNDELKLLDEQMAVGSVQKDLYPRATKARSACSTALTDVRRPVVKKAPQAGQSDRLLTDLTETNQLFAFRDDRGVVVNILETVNASGALQEPVKPLLDLLGKTAKAHPEFPVLVVVHTAKKGQEESAEQTGKAVADALQAAGAPQVAVQLANAAEPVVDRRVPQADKQNARVEIVFVTPAL